MSSLLEIKDLWGGYTEGVDILRGINMEVQRGESVGIIGLNGSGKSTLGKAIVNMIPIRRGTILFEGEDITSLRTHELARRGISIMQQGGKIFPTLSVWDNLQLANNRAKSSTINTQLQEIIPLLQRPQRELQRAMADKLSGGQKHQLSLAMTLSSNPRLVILDEPSAGLSPKAVEEMYQILIDVKMMFGLSILLIEQNISKANSYCVRSFLVAQGLIEQEFRNQEMREIEEIMFNKNK